MKLFINTDAGILRALELAARHEAEYPSELCQITRDRGAYGPCWSVSIYSVYSGEFLGYL